MFELHIYGPAFGLPSIDVNCLAAIALLQSCLPPDQDQWILIASNDPSVSPFDELPALKIDNGAHHYWVAGFRNIANYLESRSDTVHTTFKFDLEGAQRADCEAYLSFLESRGLPLLDLSLYVSSDNYTTLTRSALSEILPWPQSWMVPQRMRDRARKRADHLGLSGLDVDATREKELKEENKGLTAAIPKSLRLPKKSVTELLGSSAEQTRFKLEAVTADFFEPLEELLDAENKYLLGNKMTIIDCLVLAVASQMTISDMPQPWLKTALEKYPKLRQWTNEHKPRVFGLQPQAMPSLPWRTPIEKTWTKFVLEMIDCVADSIPVAISKNTIRTESGGSWELRNQSQISETKHKHKYKFYLQKRNQQQTNREIITACFSSAGIVGVLAYTGVLTLRWPGFARHAPPMSQTFGDAGTFLGLK